MSDKQPAPFGIPQAMRQALDQSFSEVRQDAYREGDSFYPKYIPPAPIIRRLNEVFGHDWDFEPAWWGLSPDNRAVLVQGRLTVHYWAQDPGGGWHRVPVTKSQYGMAFCKLNNNCYWDFGKDLKAAATDALRKCATLLGVGLHLYEKDESPFQGYQQNQRTQASPSPTPQTEPVNPGQAVAQPFQVQQVVSFFERMGVPQVRWLSMLGLQRPEGLTANQAIAVLNGTHPDVKTMLERAGQQPVTGLQSS